MPKRYAPTMNAGFRHFIKPGEGPLIGNTTEVEGRHKSGHEISISLSISAFQIDNEWNASASIRDITGERAAKQELELSAKKFRGFTESSSDGIFELNRQGEFTYVNKMMCDFLGCNDINELLGVSFMDIIEKKEIKKNKSLFKRMMNGEKIEGEMNFMKNKSSSFPGLFTIVTSNIEKKISTGFTGRITDYTALRKHQTIAKELRQFIETANAPIFGIDADGKVNEWNQTSEKITGFKKDEVLGKDLVETYITED
jgi:PAS domain S-box-containing protein